MSPCSGRSFFFVSLLAAAACAGSTAPDAAQIPAPSPALATLPRSLTSAERGIIDAANGFSFALWGELTKASRDSNVFVSPLSASFALGMTMNGAANSTLAQMQSTLGFGPTPLADIDAGYKSLIALLVSLDPSTTMEIANSIWYRNTFAARESFLDAATSYFDATINPLDFDSPSAPAAINGWVNDKTHGKIASIVDEIRPDAVMYLINAIYFKGSWREKFDSTETRDAPFHGVAGDQSMRLMHKESRIDYTETPAYQAVDLPYGDSAFTMTVILPKSSSTVDAVASSLTSESWRRLTTSFHPALVALDLPKLRLSWKADLVPSLQALGMHAPFSDTEADFSKMADAGRLVISSVDQKTFVNVDEVGTEAAAVTSVGVVVTSAPATTPVRVDRPFIFAIRERLSGTVLFMAKIVRMPN
jgi:serpin B